MNKWYSAFLLPKEPPALVFLNPQPLARLAGATSLREMFGFSSRTSPASTIYPVRSEKKGLHSTVILARILISQRFHVTEDSRHLCLVTPNSSSPGRQGEMTCHPTSRTLGDSYPNNVNVGVIFQNLCHELSHVPVSEFPVLLHWLHIVIFTENQFLLFMQTHSSCAVNQELCLCI